MRVEKNKLMLNHRVRDLSFYYSFISKQFGRLDFVPFAFFSSLAAFDLHIFFAFVTQ